VILIDGSPGALVHARDRGLLYGDGVFRTMRAAAGRIDCWNRHLRKLAADCAALGIDCPAADLLRDDVRRVLAAEPDGVVKIVVTRGISERGYAPPRPAVPTRIVSITASAAEAAREHARGALVRWCETRLGHQPRLAGIKHLNRLENVLARGEWSDAGFDEGLMLDLDARVIEGTASNVFIVERGRLVTPDLSRCGVDGVQRARVIEAAAREGIDCEIADFGQRRVAEADEVLLTNSVIGVRWVAALEDRRWPRGPVGRMVARWLDEPED